jgi:hypothetical protein
LAVRFFYDIGNATFDGLYRKGRVLAQFIPKRQGSLRIVIDQRTGPAMLVGMRGKMRGQSTFACSSFT